MQRVWRSKELGFILDFSTLSVLSEDTQWEATLQSMAALEAGEIANPDEGRQVGHYWLRTPELAPESYQTSIRAVIAQCQSLARTIHKEKKYKNLLLLGIGGSALGPRFLGDALKEPEDPMRLIVLDNTDIEGIARIIGSLDLEETLVICTSKSGSTPETRNALIEVQAAFARAEVAFAPQAIAISQEGSKLWNAAVDWKARVPMWDWVGGRTSVTSAVGLLPLALQGADIEAFLEGAAAMDRATRALAEENPAVWLANAWYQLAPGSLVGAGARRRAMVVLPYRDRLALLTQYLQQLVMESLGKELDVDGTPVYQGLTVYGNKGSTDQHAYVQQLRDGPDDFFATLIGFQEDGFVGEEVEPGIEAADYLQGFLLGTRQALTARHPVLMMTLIRPDAFRLGALVALFERAVGLYAAKVNINAYHQPGVEAGKKAASAFLAQKAALVAVLSEEPTTLTDLCGKAGLEASADLWYLLHRLAANERCQVIEGTSPELDRFFRA